MLPTIAKILFGVGATGMFIGWFLFVRMAIQLNRVLPPNKKFFIIELRQHIHEVKCLHEESFPVSRLRVTWFALVVGSAITIAAAIIVAIKPT
jgi:hypothetical protein